MEMRAGRIPGRTKGTMQGEEAGTVSRGIWPEQGQLLGLGNWGWRNWPSQNAEGPRGLNVPPRSGSFGEYAWITNLPKRLPISQTNYQSPKAILYTHCH